MVLAVQRIDLGRYDSYFSEGGTGRRTDVDGQVGGKNGMSCLQGPPLYRPGSGDRGLRGWGGDWGLCRGYLPGEKGEESGVGRREESCGLQ